MKVFPFSTCRLEGSRGFYKGLLPSLFRVVPACCITFVVYEHMMHWLLSDQLTSTSKEMKAISLATSDKQNDDSVGKEIDESVSMDTDNIVKDTGLVAKGNVESNSEETKSW